MNERFAPLKIGILGLGHLGKIHLKCLRQLTEYYTLVGFYDPDTRATQIAQQQFGLKAFPDHASLIDAVDVVDIVAPTLAHLTLARAAIRRGKHVFIEKPIANSVAEAQQIVRAAQIAGVKVQIGHVERFNPAFLALKNQPLQPMFIEGHRLATFNPRGTDVSVVLDLMIHDLDLILNIVKSKPTKVSASGVAVVSSSPDIANARIEFANGCVANLTASRISLKQMRKIRLFQRDAYISLDFLKKETQIIRLSEPGANDNALMQIDTNAGKKNIVVELPSVAENNAIQDELATFARAIRSDATVAVSAADGLAALELAQWILNEIEAGK